MKSQAEINGWAEAECRKLGELVAKRLDATQLTAFIEECRTDHILEELLITRRWAYEVGLDYQGEPINQELDATLESLVSHDVTGWTHAVGYLIYAGRLTNILSKLKGE